MFKPVKTPCVGVCSTGLGDHVCRGCKRFVHEVMYWNAYSNDERYLIARRLEGFLTQVVSNKLQIVDEAKLLAAIKHQQLRFNPEQGAYCWLFDLLRAGASQIDDLSVYGVVRQPDWQDETLVAIKQAIEQDYYTLSCAYYERYFSQPA
ncbi:MAG: DUF1289 domain-containing protein [Gammaproteobacteria bacterium]|uniref:DUF1289 domain-containing protein n=1 Tax=Pseudomaricurvus alcaniphilus TaxID=1166482 RepID=UPI00140CCA1B|nr:DUF1289 domain-containing protein [Pseudomaricurvus alcaniphilus]MBR9911672.1 DUF1289 domain-containing protein [Gammaproteobacteria bacterium]NHN39383.1 DUF1289 domain-containing protein [Pseudomaricurvus alcaniphilus]